MKKINIAVNCLIVDNNNNILIAKRNPKSFEGNKWSIPGGTLEFGETLKEGLRREIYEELKIGISNIQFIKTYEYIKKSAHTVVFYYKANPTSKDIKLRKEELTEFIWDNLDNVKNIDLAFNQKQVLEDIEL